MSQPPPIESLDLEREYVAHRSAVMGMLRSEFPRVPDPEELYQEAWAEALELRARGSEIVKLDGLLKTIAWRRARDRARNWHADLVDPDSVAFTSVPDAGPTPDELSDTHLDAFVVRQVIEELEPRQAAILKMRFGLQMDSREIQHQLGVTSNRLEKLVTETYACIAAQLEGEPGELTRWQRRQRSLLLACEMGLASPRQREKARRMVAEDPNCRAMLRSMRSTLEQVAAVLPLPVIAEQRGERPFAAVFDRIAACADSAREWAVALIPRAGGQASTIEQAGAAGLGTSLATKAVIACVVVGGGTAACVESGILDRGAAKPSPKPAPVKRAEKPTTTPAPRKPVVRPATQKPPARETERKTTTTQATSSSKASPSPAPTGSQEFGPGAVGSTEAPSTPAAAPASGGGEFGP